MRIVALGLAMLAWWLPDLASACGASPEPYLTIDRIDSERFGATRYLDGAIAIDLHRWEVTDSLFSSLQPRVELFELASGADVPGSFDGQVFRPDQPLTPATEYRVVVVTNDEPLPEFDGPSRMEHRFVSGTEFAQPLELAAQLSFALRVDTVEFEHCRTVNSCGQGSDCETREREALFADVILPPARGGVGPVYQAVLAYGGGGVREFDGAGEGSGDGVDAIFESLHYQQAMEGQAGFISVELFAEGEPYEPCFAYNVWDMAGNAAHTAARCLAGVDVEQRLGLEPVTDSMAAAPESDPTAGDRAGAGGSDDEAVHVAHGCAVIAPGTSAGSWALLVGGLALGLARRRRRIG